jgi:hypothetical protein
MFYSIGEFHSNKKIRIKNMIVRIKYLKSFKTLFQSEFWPLSFGEGLG